MSGLLTYRGYVYFQVPKNAGKDKTDEGMSVRYIFRHNSINPHLPRSFTWKATQDIQGLHYYIDGLVDNNQTILTYYEEKRFVENLVYTENRDAETITLNPLLLLSILRGEYPILLDKVANVTVRCFTDKYMPTAFPAALADESLLPYYYKALCDKIKEGKHIIVNESLNTIGKNGRAIYKNENMKHPGINLQTADKQLPPQEYENTFTYPIETFVSRIVEADHLIITTHILLENQTHYYCKRHLSPQGVLLKLETSWDGIEWREPYKKNKVAA